RVKVTFTVQLPPAASVAPRSLLCESSPLVSMEVMSTALLVPLFTFTTCGALLVPTFCEPNVKLVGVTVNWGELEAPVPVSDTFCGLLEAESVSVSVPVRVPPAVGVKVTLTVQLAPAARLLPQLLLCEKSPLVVMELNVTAPAVSLVAVTVLAALLVPTFCDANVRLVGVVESAGCAPLTLMKIVCLKIVVPSLACTVSRRVPAAMVTVVSSVPPEPLNFSAPSTYTCMVCTGLESLVPATM